MRIALTGESDVRIEVANRGLPIDPIGPGLAVLFDFMAIASVVV